LSPADRFLWAWLSSVWNGWESRVSIVKAATVIGWHRKGFGLFWSRKIRHGKYGRPAVPQQVRELIRMLSRDNPLWGRSPYSRRTAQARHRHRRDQRHQVHGPAPQASVTDLEDIPGQSLENHGVSGFFVVPTIRFQILYVFVVLAHERRRILHFAVTARPTAEWTAQQMREAFPWDTVPRYLLHDRDRIFGEEFVKQVKAMGIKQVLSAPRSPWQRAYVERVIGTIRRECLDHLIVFNEHRLHRHLQAFVDYYHRHRVHLALANAS
jgi:transposase InsO family protein